MRGGQGKKADFTPLLPIFKRYVKQVILIGEASDELNHLFQNHISVARALNLKDAVLKAQACAKVNDCVLLSPACASLDMFKNYIERGEIFKEVVHAL